MEVLFISSLPDGKKRSGTWEKKIINVMIMIILYDFCLKFKICLPIFVAPLVASDRFIAFKSWKWFVFQAIDFRHWCEPIFLLSLIAQKLIICPGSRCRPFMVCFSHRNSLWFRYDIILLFWYASNHFITFRFITGSQQASDMKFASFSLDYLICIEIEMKIIAI